MFVSDSGHNHTGWVPIDEFDGKNMVASIIYLDEM